MMKKTAALLLAAALCASLFACGEKNKSSDDAADGITAGELTAGANGEDAGNGEEKTETKKEEKAEVKLLPETYSLPLYNIYVDVPSFHRIECGFTMLFKENDTSAVSFNCERFETAEDAKAAFDITFPECVNDISSHSQLTGIKEVISEENTEVNGIPVYHVKAKATCGRISEYEGFADCYAFVFEGLPCCIVGAVTDTEPTESGKNGISEIVDAMMKTVRNKP